MQIRNPVSRQHSTNSLPASFDGGIGYHLQDLAENEPETFYLFFKVCFHSHEVHAEAQY